MMLCFVVLWALPVVFYGPKLWGIIASGKTPLEILLLSIFSVFHIIFWLLAAYFTAVVLFSFLSRRPSPSAGVSDDEWPAVAILYATRNDFCAEAAASCLSQDYPDFHLFLLDDSTDGDFSAQVEAFHAAHPDRTTVVRRPDRHGFKPALLNYAIRSAAKDYSFFAPVDADERLPVEFLRRTMAHMRNSDLAFAQANHAPNPQQAAVFARDIGPTILPFWDVHCRARNRFGLVVYVGHGAVVRRSAWEAVGGFPEVVTEDLAFTALVTEAGLSGVFLDDVVCYEDFPADYRAFRRQQERYVVGTTQVIREFAGRLLRSRRAGLTEKIDFLLWCTPLYVPALCLAFVALCTIGLATVFGSWGHLTISLHGQELSVPMVRILDERFSPLWSWHFQLVSVIGAFSPAFASMALGAGKRVRAVRLLFLSTMPYLSLMLLSWVGVLRYLITGRVKWSPTGEKPPVESESRGFPTSTGIASRLTDKCLSALKSPSTWEVLLGGILAVASLICFNIAFFAVSLCLLMGPYVCRFGWERRSARLGSAGCFTLIVSQMAANLCLMVHSPGLVPLVFSVNF